MRISLKIAALFALIWFTGRILLFKFQIFQDESGVKYLVMWNILCLLTGMAIGTLIEKRKEDRSNSSALGDIKNTLGSGLIYMVLVSIFIYSYYSKIDTGYNERQLTVAEAALQKTLNDPREMAKIRKNTELSSLTKEELLEKGLANQKAMFNPGYTMTISLLGMLLLSTVNAIVLTVIFRKVLFQERTI